MAERIYPSTKPPATLHPPPGAVNGGTTTTTTNSNTNGMNGNHHQAFPPTKAQMYGATRPAYRPQPKPRRRRRSCWCACFLWSTFIIILLLLLAAIAGGVLYLLYRPQRPSFTLTSLKISQLKITTSKDETSSKLNSKVDLSVTTRNPNKDLTFFYDPISISVISSTGAVDVGDGSIPAFVHKTKNTTVLRSTISNQNRELDPLSLKGLRTDLKRKSGLPLKIEFQTKVRVKIGGTKMKKILIEVTCDGINAVSVPSKGKTPVATWKLSESSDPKCKVNLRIKIWKWTF